MDHRDLAQLGPSGVSDVVDLGLPGPAKPLSDPLPMDPDLQPLWWQPWPPCQLLLTAPHISLWVLIQLGCGELAVKVRGVPGL